MATTIQDFYPGTTKVFTVTCKINTVAQNITSDTVTFRMKTGPNVSDANASLEIAADVSTSGALGIAIFELAAGSNTLAPGKYWADIEWILADTSEYIIVDQKITVLNRLSDA